MRADVGLLYFYEDVLAELEAVGDLGGIAERGRQAEMEGLRERIKQIEAEIEEEYGPEECDGDEDTDDDSDEEWPAEAAPGDQGR